MNSRRRKSRSVHRPVTSPAVLSPPRSAGPETGDGAKKKRPPCSSHDAPMSGAPPSHWVFSLAITSGLGRPLGTIPRFREGSRRGAAAGERPGARTPPGINGKRRYRTQNTSEHPHLEADPDSRGDESPPRAEAPEGQKNKSKSPILLTPPGRPPPRFLAIRSHSPPDRLGLLDFKNRLPGHPHPAYRGRQTPSCPATPGSPASRPRQTRQNTT